MLFQLTGIRQNMTWKISSLRNQKDLICFVDSKDQFFFGIKHWNLWLGENTTEEQPPTTTTWKITNVNF